jgi:hypothetical protein
MDTRNEEKAHMESMIEFWLEKNPDTLAWLEQHYRGRADYHAKRNISFNLPFDEYIHLWKLRRLKEVAKLIENGRITRRMRHPQKGWVLSWTNKAARAGGEMNATTACIIQRETSKRRFYLQAGDKHTEAAKQRIGDAKRGKPISAKHKQAISKARTGVPQSEEHKRKRIEAMKATKARNRLAQVA